MANTTSNWKIFKSLDYSIQIMLKQTIDYLSGKFNQSLQVFTAASPFGQVILVLENLSQMIFYYIEDSITELSIIDATRLSSVYSIATIAGHNPSRAISASGEIGMKSTSAARQADFDTILIPNLSRIKSLNNGLQYVLSFPQDDIKFSMKGNTDGLTAKILQGIIETQVLTAKGQEIESFSINSPQNFLVDNYLVDVYVNSEKWTRYNSILDMPRGAKGFLVKTGVTTGVDIYFGNESFGKIPNRGSEIKVEYLVNNGAQGNITTDQVSQVKFEWSDTGFTLTGKEVELNEYITIETVHSPQFGANPEDQNLTRLIAPKTSKSFALVNVDHYESVLSRLKLFSIISVFLDELDSRMLNLFLVPDVSNLFNTGQDYFSIDPAKFKLSEFRKNELLRYLDKTGSKLISTDVKIVDPVIKKYVINVSIIAFDDVAIEVIKRDIYNELGNYFIKNKRMKRIPKSDLVRVLENVAGIDSVSINLVSEANEKAKINDPNAATIGLDEFNDILIKEFELAIIQGGFKDRYGNEYSQGISEEALGSVNIQVKNIVPRPLSLQ